MAETKADLIKKAKELGVEHVKPSNTMAELREAIANAAPKKHDKEALPVEEHEAVVAKAGKRSAKGLKDAEEKAEKVEQQLHREETEKAATEAAKKSTQKPARSRVERAGKKFRDAAKLIDQNKTYSLKEAVELAIKTSTTKFDSTVELHVRLSVDPKQADQNVRDTLVLPAGTGNNIRVAVFAEADDVAKAKKAGADVAGTEDFLQLLDKNVIEFDTLIATPAVMAKLGKYARVLGPKGLMPSPKSGTVTTNVEKAVKEAKAGKVEYRVDSAGIVHVGAGKVSFGADRLMQNLDALMASINSNKPASLKSIYIRSTFITTSMGPSIRVS